MRHHNSTRKLGRTRKVRKALMKSLVVGLIRDEKIKTTEAKAKELRPMIEKIVTKSFVDTVTARRNISSVIGPKGGVEKLFKTIGPRFKDRKGGYTRIMKLPVRKSDGSKMAIIEFV